MDAHARLLLHYEPVPVVDEAFAESADQFLVEPAQRAAPRLTLWRIAAAVAVSLAIGVNLSQSASNSGLVSNSTSGRIAAITDAEAQRLADEIEGLTASEAKRFVWSWSQREDMLMLPLLLRQPPRQPIAFEP
jgi:hypothetical protein